MLGRLECSRAAMGNRTVLLLEGAALPNEPRRGSWDALVRVSGPLEAAGLFGRHRPLLLLASPEIRWHQELIRALPPERRPAVLAVGSEPTPPFDWFDEWVEPAAPAATVEARWGLALERGRQRRHAARRIFTDALTGLANRRAVLRALVRQARRAKREQLPLSLVLIDLDHFKRVNDEQGHEAGDALLRRIGRAATTAVAELQSYERLKRSIAARTPRSMSASTASGRCSRCTAAPPCFQSASGTP